MHQSEAGTGTHPAITNPAVVISNTCVCTPLVFVFPPPVLSAHLPAHLCPSVCRALQVRAVSARLLELHALLGGGADIDVIWMVTREPTLLTASKHQLISRLMAMKVSLGHEAL